ncbi:MAG: ribokinase, partial [Chloroflexi bacterium]|nr:ribokinase [Chloroflexota bacterium]
DCFNGALATKIYQNTPIKEGLDYAIRASSLSTLKQGASQSFPCLEDI